MTTSVPEIVRPHCLRQLVPLLPRRCLLLSRDISSADLSHSHVPTACCSLATPSPLGLLREEPIDLLICWKVTRIMDSDEVVHYREPARDHAGSAVSAGQKESERGRDAHFLFPFAHSFRW